MKSTCEACLWKFLNNPVLLLVLFIISVFTCVVIELDLGFILCKSERFVKATNNILLAISYGYISSSIFHFFVNVSPKKYEKHLMEDWVRIWLGAIREDLRLTKVLIINPYSFESEPTEKSVYINKFCGFDFENEAYAFNNSVKVLEKLNEYRHTLNNNISLLLYFRDFLSSEQAEFVVYAAKSKFLTNNLIPHREGSSFDDNQKDIGESIYDLYEKAKNIAKNY